MRHRRAAEPPAVGDAAASFPVAASGCVLWALLGALAGCGSEAALSAAGEHAAPTSDAPDAATEGNSAPDPDSDESTDGETIPAPSSPAPVTPPPVTPVPDSFVVPASETRQEVTQVYNGQTHVVSDTEASLRAESEEVAVFVQDDLAAQVTAAQLDGFMTRLVATGDARSFYPDLGILPTNEAVFGALKRSALPDGKQRVFVVDTSGAGDGYLCGWCTYPDLHLDGHLVSPLDGETAFSISAHELYHAIHRGYDTDEEVWIDESIAEAAMTVNGYFTDQAWLSDYLSTPNVDWGPSGADVTSVHYGACLAFGTYLWEQGGPELMQAITKEPANGWEGLDAALVSSGESRTAWELFLELGAALYFDDADRGLGIRSFALPRAVRSTTLAGDLEVDLEPYGFAFYELEGDLTFTVDGNAVSAVYVAEAAELRPETVTPGAAFSASGPGVLVLTARSATTASVQLD